MSEETSKKVKLLGKLEKKATFCTMAMMAYNPSIGRVLKKGGVDQFINLAWQMAQNLDSIQNRHEFDAWHDKFAQRLRDEIDITSKGKRVSYGQAQKPINVFLKLYVDWANLPNLKVATRLRPFLHVPLDSRVMKYARVHFPKYYRNCGLRRSSLATIDKEQYYRWQECFRKVSPEKPLLIDVLWAIRRFTKVFRTIISLESRA